MSDYETVREDIGNRLGLTNLENFDVFTDNVAQIESNNGENTVSTISSARGIFQFLTEGDNNAFQTGLNRLERHLEDAEWIDEARDHNDPNRLSENQQRALFLANIYQQRGTDDYLRRIAEGDNQAMAEAYSRFHHTVEDIHNDPRISRIFDLDQIPASTPTEEQSDVPTMEWQEEQRITEDEVIRRARAANTFNEAMSESDPSMYRKDGSRKSSQGFLGPIKNTAGETMTEFSTDLGSEYKGYAADSDIPTMVPGLNAAELALLKQSRGGKPLDMSMPLARSIVNKARKHAKERIDAGLSPFYQDLEERTDYTEVVKKARTAGTFPEAMQE